MDKKFIYQIYPISFNSHNNKATGDIQGITDKLDYLENLGVDYLWLTPVFSSPMNDNGYDVANYLEINPSFGTMEDLKTLIQEAKKKNIKIMLDMVFNHTSTEHEWFQGFKNKDPKYKDYYIYKEGKEKPNNWESKFGGNAWEPIHDGHYLHLFDKTQADLNWKNPEVRNELKKVIDFYLSIGIKGFRFDVINLISKESFEDDDDIGKTIYTDGSKVHEYIKEITQNLQDDDTLTVGEMSSVKIENAIEYSSSTTNELDSIFTFHHLKTDYPNGEKFGYMPSDNDEFYNLLKYWHEELKANNAVMANFLNNHDQPRSVNRYAPDKNWLEAAKSQFMLISYLPGPTFLYQGEEIGMKSPKFDDISKYRDVETLNYLKINNLTEIPKGVMEKSRDNARTPMQWNSEVNAGFTTATPWISVADDYKEINTEKQVNQKDSIFEFYKHIIKSFKNNKVISEGTVEFNKLSNDIWSITRMSDDIIYEMIISFNKEEYKYETKDQPVFFTSKFNGVIKPFNSYIFKRG